jgi:hypothetical protein
MYHLGTAEHFSKKKKNNREIGRILAERYEAFLLPVYLHYRQLSPPSPRSRRET